MDHQDLWRQVSSIIESKPANFFGIRKVKAHVTQAAVDQGIITAFERYMNEGVDKLAKQAGTAGAQATGS